MHKKTANRTASQKTGGWCRDIRILLSPLPTRGVGFLPPGSLLVSERVVSVDGCRFPQLPRWICLAIVCSCMLLVPS